MRIMFKCNGTYECHETESVSTNSVKRVISFVPKSGGAQISLKLPENKDPEEVMTSLAVCGYVVL